MVTEVEFPKSPPLVSVVFQSTVGCTQYHRSGMRFKQSASMEGLTSSKSSALTLLERDTLACIGHLDLVVPAALRRGVKRRGSRRINDKHCILSLDILGSGQLRDVIAIRVGYADNRPCGVDIRAVAVDGRVVV